MILFSMWKNTRMIVLVAVTAALYAAILIPFKVLVIIPGITEVRPAAAIPVVCSILFGPAAAWGAAIGNLVGDVFGGTLTPSSPFGFVGNFLYGLLPFLIWRGLTRTQPNMRAILHYPIYLAACVISSAVCAVVIGYGVDLCKIAPFKAVASAIFINNTGVSFIFGAILLLALYPAVRALGLTYHQLAAADRDTESDLDDETAPTARPELKG